MTNFVYDENGYIDVRRSGAVEGENVSGFFPKDAKGFAINDGLYLVDAETLVRLTETPVCGNGRVKWYGFHTTKSEISTSYFDGIIPVSKLHDPVYMSMNLPSEATTYMKYRINPSNMYSASPDFRKVLSIGAIYKAEDAVIDDDEEITVCLGKINVILRTKDSDGWFKENEQPFPSKPNHIYYLPWRLEWDRVDAKGNEIPEDERRPVKPGSITEDRLKEFNDHIEIKLYGRDFTGRASGDDRVEGSVLHFWGKNALFEDGSNILGVVISYEAWLKEESASGKVAAAIGADWRTGENKIRQAFSGYNHRLTSKRRTVIGHNVGNDIYDEIMEPEKIRELIFGKEGEK